MTAHSKLSKLETNLRSHLKFLQWEADQSRKYEYEYGEVMAMTGGIFLIMRLRRILLLC